MPGLILLLIIVGGLIAYLGDKIGMKVGRKHITILGLRPRHSAVVITILSGVVIALLTISCLAIASENVRLALFELEDLLAEKDELTVEIITKERELNNLSYNLKLFNNRSDSLITLDNKLYNAGETIVTELIVSQDNLEEIKISLNSLLARAYWELNQQGVKKDQIHFNQDQLLDTAKLILVEERDYLLSLVSKEDIYYKKKVELEFNIYQIFE